MRIDGDTPIDVLMHGNNVAYVDLDEGELMHWKYIKKTKRPNGKWRYYYDVKDALGYDERERMNAATKEMLKAEGDARNFQDFVSYQEYMHPGDEHMSYINDLHKDAKAKNDKVKELEKKASAAVAEYSKTPLAKIDKAKTSFQRAKQKVSGWLNKLANKFKS